MSCFIKLFPSYFANQSSGVKLRLMEISVDKQQRETGNFIRNPSQDESRFLLDAFLKRFYRKKGFMFTLLMLKVQTFFSRNILKN